MKEKYVPNAVIRDSNKHPIGIIAKLDVNTDKFLYACGTGVAPGCIIIRDVASLGFAIYNNHDIGIISLFDEDETNNYLEKLRHIDETGDMEALNNLLNLLKNRLVLMREAVANVARNTKPISCVKNAQT